MPQIDNQPNPSPPRLILASASPRREQLLREHGYEIEVIAPPLDEPAESLHALPPARQAEALSYFKARSVSAVAGDAWILSGDTIVSLNDKLFGKPVDLDDARRILTALAGTTHHVITGVTLLDAATNRRLIRSDSTAVSMRSMTDEGIEDYLATGAWAGKAGAFGIQDHGDAFVTRIDGSFTNVVGFPMELVANMLQEWGYEPPRGRM